MLGAGRMCREGLLPNFRRVFKVTFSATALLERLLDFTLLLFGPIRRGRKRKGGSHCTVSPGEAFARRHIKASAIFCDFGSLLSSHCSAAKALKCGVGLGGVVFSLTTAP